MILILFFNLVFSAPHTMIVNGQRMNEWAPIVYDTSSNSLIINDFICDPWLPLKELESIQDKALKGGLLTIFFKKTGRFYFLSQLNYNPSTLTWYISSFDSLQCRQITIFKDGLE